MCRCESQHPKPLEPLFGLLTISAIAHNQRHGLHCCRAAIHSQMTAGSLSRTQAHLVQPKRLDVIMIAHLQRPHLIKGVPGDGAYFGGQAVDEDSAHRLLVSLSSSYARQRIHSYLRQSSRSASELQTWMSLLRCNHSLAACQCKRNNCSCTGLTAATDSGLNGRATASFTENIPGQHLQEKAGPSRARPFTPNSKLWTRHR